MSTQLNAAVARAFYEALNDHDFDRAASLFAEDAEWLNAAVGLPIRGRGAIRLSLQGWAAGFPDFSLDITNLVVKREWVVVEFTFRGTHTGPLPSPTGPIAPTGQLIELPCCEVLSVREGKIQHWRTYTDAVTFRHQLGLMPLASAA